MGRDDIPFPSKACFLNLKWVPPFVILHGRDWLLLIWGYRFTVSWYVFISFILSFGVKQYCRHSHHLMKTRWFVWRHNYFMQTLIWKLAEEMQQSKSLRTLLLFCTSSFFACASFRGKSRYSLRLGQRKRFNKNLPGGLPLLPGTIG